MGSFFSQKISKNGKKTFVFLNASLFQPKRKETWSTSWGSNRIRNKNNNQTIAAATRQSKTHGTSNGCLSKNQTIFFYLFLLISLKLMGVFGK
jgi:hypothetical protein